MRYIVTTWHGEGNTLFYVRDTATDETVLTFQTVEHETREDAELFCTRMNARYGN